MAVQQIAQILAPQEADHSVGLRVPKIVSPKPMWLATLARYRVPESE